MEPIHAEVHGDLTEQAIRDTLRGVLEPDGIERNPLTPGEWVVWACGVGCPVYTIDDVRDLPGLLFGGRHDPRPDVRTHPEYWCE